MNRNLSRHGTSRPVVLLSVVVIALIAGVWYQMQESVKPSVIKSPAIALTQSPEQRPPMAAPLPAASATATTAPADPAMTKLLGNWRRPDGGYVLVIQGITDKGIIDAVYLNPRPIHIGKAEASKDGETLKVFVELRDVNYPGSTYTLSYDPASDQLQGIYYQAAAKESFDVFFTRIK